jgi:uncharacterized protein
VIAYFDSSALIPLLIEEPGSERAGRVWDVADHVTSVRLIHAEARAALAQASRLGRLGPCDLATAIDALDGLYDQLDLLEVDDPLVRRAGELAQHHALRAYDAIHLAAAERVRHATTILVACLGTRTRRAPELLNTLMPSGAASGSLPGA